MAGKVHWDGAIQLKINHKPIHRRNKSWIDIARPRSSGDIVGNSNAIRSVRDWFCSVRSDTPKLKCLLVTGPSGVWKSSAISCIAQEQGYGIVHTYSNAKRTPQKLDTKVREIFLSDKKTIFILDEFESFARESTCIKWVLAEIKNKSLLLVIISNEVEPCMNPVRQLYQLVEFRAYTKREMFITLIDLSRKIKSICNLPPMDCYFVSQMCGGDVSQTVNQIQFTYGGGIDNNISYDKGKHPQGPKKYICKGGKSTKKRGNKTLIVKKTQLHNNNRNLHFLLSSHRSNILHYSAKGWTNTSVHDVSDMAADSITELHKTLHEGYLSHFHSGSLSTIEEISKCAGELSLADCSTRRDPDIDAESSSNRSVVDRTLVSDTSNLQAVGPLWGCISILRKREEAATETGSEKKRGNVSNISKNRKRKLKPRGLITDGRSMDCLGLLRGGRHL